MSLTYTQITGTFTDGTGQPLNNLNITFTPSATVYASGVPVATPGSGITAEVIGGSLKSPSGGTMQLLATDNTGLTVEGRTGFWYWNVVVTGALSDGWSFFLPSSPSIVDLYSLANSAAGGGGGFTSPMTALGDMIDGGASGAATRLAGNTATTRKFLRSAGNGTNATAPAWDTLQAADVPGVDGVAVSGTPSAGNVLTATSSSAADWAAPSGGFQAWQFQPETYGAKGDGQVVADVATTGSSTVITSASGKFTSGDVGKYIMINGARGTNTGPLITTIASFQSATQVTLTAPALVTATGCAAVWATDDTAAINAAISAAKAYALAGNYAAEVVFGPKTYGVAGLTQQTGPTYNTQILIPYPDETGAGRKLNLALHGPVRTDQPQFWESTAPNLAGTCLVSFRTAPASPDGTFGFQSVIGGPSSDSGFTGGFVNTKITLENLSVWCGAYTNEQAFDFTWLGGCHVDGYASNIFAPPVNGTAPVLSQLSADSGFTATIGCGGLFPAAGNNDDVTCPSVVFEGYELGFRANDHFTGGRIAVIYSNAVISLDFSAGITASNHMVSIQQLSAEVYNGGIRCLAGTGYCNIDIHFDAETGATPAYDVYDNGNALHGTLHFDDITSSRAPIIGSGAASLKIISDQLGPGAWSGQPSVPSSGTGQPNSAFRDAAVSVKGGTVSAITVDGATVATATGTTVIVPGGKTITLTYSAAPTWQWVLL